MGKNLQLQQRKIELSSNLFSPRPPPNGMAVLAIYELTHIYSTEEKQRESISIAQVPHLHYESRTNPTTTHCNSYCLFSIPKNSAIIV